MKLSYCINPRGNFGDDLNSWFWDRAAPGLLDDKEDELLLGMGTILGRWFTDGLPDRSTKIVLGSGAGEKGPLPPIDKSWRFYGVRGPLTAAYFGLEPNMVLADPAVLISEFTELYHSSDRSGVGFMPHIWTTWDWDWEQTCAELGLTYINPRADSHETIKKISGLERLITEAMHGAIVADAIRVPWVAARISHKFESSKWSDWGGSLGLDIQFRHLPQIRHGKSTPYKFLRDIIKRNAASIGCSFKHMPNCRSRAFEIITAERSLRHLAREMPAQLSNGNKLSASVARLRSAISRLQDDKERGILNII